MSRAYRVAMICGAVPLLVGLAIFLLWLITRWGWLMLAGVFTLYAGVVAVALGIIGLAMSPEVRRARPRLACAALLLVNFPVAFAICYAAVAVKTGYTVVVHNDSQKSLDRVRVSGGGCDVSFGTIPPGASVHRTMRFRQDGRLEF